MGIDFSSPLIKLVHSDSKQLEFFEFEFVNYQFFYFVTSKEVDVWKNKVA
jgi:hypothetical protein